MKFKKTFAVLAASLLLGGALAGCGGGEKKAAEALSIRSSRSLRNRAV